MSEYLVTPPLTVGSNYCLLPPLSAGNLASLTPLRPKKSQNV